MPGACVIMPPHLLLPFLSSSSTSDQAALLLIQFIVCCFSMWLGVNVVVYALITNGKNVIQMSCHFFLLIIYYLH